MADVSEREPGPRGNRKPKVIKTRLSRSIAGRDSVSSFFPSFLNKTNKEELSLK